MAATADATVPDVVAPPPRHPRFPLFDGLRAIAVLSVVGVHADLAANGYIGNGLVDRLLAHLNVGVTIFFVISGFLLYRPFIAHRAQGAQAPALRDYGKRRFLRIYPAYWLVLTVLTIGPGVTGVYGGQWWQQYAILHTLPLHGGSSCTDAFQECGLAQTWSLVIELTFYAALPIYAVVAARLLRNLRLMSWMIAELVLLGGLSAVSVLLRFTTVTPISSPWIATSVLGSIFWFALGMGLAVASVGLGPGQRRTGIPTVIPLHSGFSWIVAGVVYVTLALVLPATPILFDRGDQLVDHLLLGLVAVLLVFPAVFDGEVDGLPRRLLANRIVAWLGLISYGVFLWHYVVILQLDGGSTPFIPVLFITLAVTIPCSAASYYFVERPLLRLKYHRIRDVVRGRGGSGSNGHAAHDEGEADRARVRIPGEL